MHLLIDDLGTIRKNNFTFIIMEIGGGNMPFNILVGAGLFVHQSVDRSILNVIQGKDIIVIGNGNTLTSKSFRLQEEMVKKLEASGARKVIYTELTSRNMSILKKTDILYIMGGDVRELVELYQNELFKSLLKKHLKKGLLITEGEATALLSSHIDWYLKECCHLKKQKYQSLGVIDENFYIFYHYDDQSLDEKIKKIEEKYQIELKCLKEEDCYFTSSIV